MKVLGGWVCEALNSSSEICLLSLVSSDQSSRKETVLSLYKQINFYCLAFV